MCSHLCEYVYICVTVVQPVEYIRIMGERKHHQWVWKLQLRLFHDWKQLVQVTSSRS